MEDKIRGTMERQSDGTVVFKPDSDNQPAGFISDAPLGILAIILLNIMSLALFTVAGMYGICFFKRFFEKCEGKKYKIYRRCQAILTLIFYLAYLASQAARMFLDLNFGFEVLNVSFVAFLIIQIPFIVVPLLVRKRFYKKEDEENGAA